MVVGRKLKLSDILDFEPLSLITPFLNKETWDTVKKKCIKGLGRGLSS